MLYEDQRDFLNQITSIDVVCEHYKLHVNGLINSIGTYIINVLENIKNEHNDLYDEYIKKITTSSFDYAGSMTESEFIEFCFKCKNNALTINNSRNIVNMMWSFIKIVVSNLIFVGVTKNTDEHYLTFKSQITKGVEYLCKYVNIDRHQLLCMINDCFEKLELEFGLDVLQTINKNQFYKYIIRLSFLEPRKIADFQKADKSEYAIEIFYKSSQTFKTYIDNHLTNSEKIYAELHNSLPFGGKMIGSLNINTNYYRFCEINKIYKVCGLSGSTFELMMYFLMFDVIDIKNEAQLKSLIALFIHFNLIRGSHSDLEVVCAIEKLCKWCQPLTAIFENIKKNDTLTFNKGRLSENLLLGLTSDINKLKYRLA